MIAALDGGLVTPPPSKVDHWPEQFAENPQTTANPFRPSQRVAGEKRRAGVQENTIKVEK